MHQVASEQTARRPASRLVTASSHHVGLCDDGAYQLTALLPFQLLWRHVGRACNVGAVLEKVSCVSCVQVAAASPPCATPRGVSTLVPMIHTKSSRSPASSSQSAREGAAVAAAKKNGCGGKPGSQVVCTPLGCTRTCPCLPCPQGNQSGKPLLTSAGFLHLQSVVWGTKLAHEVG